jgi:hypothetical protein
MQVKELIKSLKMYLPDEEVAYILWTRADVRMVAERDYDVKLSNLECDEILADMHHHADAESGMAWTTLETYIVDYYVKNIKSEKELL